MSITRPTKRLRTISTLLLSGHNPLSPPLAYSQSSRQSPTNPSLTPLPFHQWLGSVGRAKDVHNGWKITSQHSPNHSSIALGYHHALVGYRSDETDRVFAVGRNEAGQLGIGYASQEVTRGMVEGFQGDRIASMAAGVQSTYLLLEREGSFEFDQNRFFKSTYASSLRLSKIEALCMCAVIYQEVDCLSLQCILLRR